MGDLDDGVLIAHASEIAGIYKLIDTAEDDLAFHVLEEAMGAECVMAAACDFFGLRTKENVSDVALAEGLAAANDTRDDLAGGVVGVGDWFEFLQAEIACGAGCACVLLPEMFHKRAMATAEFGTEAVHLIEQAHLAGKTFVRAG